MPRCRCRWRCSKLYGKSKYRSGDARGHAHGLCEFHAWKDLWAEQRMNIEGQCSVGNAYPDSPKQMSGGLIGSNRHAVIRNCRCFSKVLSLQPESYTETPYYFGLGAGIASLRGWENSPSLSVADRRHHSQSALCNPHSGWRSTPRDRWCLPRISSMTARTGTEVGKMVLDSLITFVKHKVHSLIFFFCAARRQKDLRGLSRTLSAMPVGERHSRPPANTSADECRNYLNSF